MLLARLRALFISDPLIVLSTAFHGTLNLIADLFGAGEDTQVKIARHWAKSLLQVSGVHVRVEGLEKIDPGGSYVFVSNHVSYMDTPVIFTHIPVNFRFLAKSELFKWPFIGTHLTRARHISVPLEARAALKAMADASHTLKSRGISLLVFPEGGRSEDGTLQEFKDGAAYLAIKGGVPLVPIGLIGMHEILPMHSAIVRAGHAVLRVGEPIPTEALKLHDRGRITQELRDRIAELSGQAAYTQTK
jgi:1-acyl-sn-glycerol-3-phosphate acyltransferase